MLRRSFAFLVSASDIDAKLRASPALQPLTSLTVKDVSAGCGSFFDIHIISPAFGGKPLVQQHRLVNGILQEEIRQIHGFTLHTGKDAQAPKSATPPVRPG